jgi:2-oxoglutarate dehydrogenase E1 component
VGLYEADLDGKKLKELDLKSYPSLLNIDLNQKINLGTDTMSGFLSHKNETLSVGHLLNRLKEVYMQKIGIQYMHIDDQEKKNWIRERIETPQKFSFSKSEKAILLERVMYAELFEKFCATKFPTTKRFGLEGVEALIPGLNTVMDELTTTGSKNFM